MWLFLASLAGLFPAAALPMGLGWKQLSAFDVFFVAAILQSVWTRRFGPLNKRLILAALSLSAAGLLSLLVHWPPLGWRSVLRTAYSVAVLLLTAHIRVNLLEVRRAIRLPLALSLALAWLIFLAENALGVSIGNNDSDALPSALRRLGGFTGGNALVLFICFGMPFILPRATAAFAVMLSGYATLSRSILGLGISFLLAARRGFRGPRGVRTLTLVLAWGAIPLALLAYAFALVPVDPARRSSLIPSLETGGYVAVHRTALAMIASQPLVGVGPGRFPNLYQDFTTAQERAEVAGAPIRRLPHSAVLGLAAEQGLIGLSAFIWLMFEVYRALRRNPDQDQRTRACAALTGLLVGGYFVDWIALKGLWLWIGLTVAASRPSRNPVAGTDWPLRDET